MTETNVKKRERRARVTGPICRIVATLVCAMLAPLPAPILEAQASGQAAVAPPLGSLPGIQPVAPLADGQWTMPAGDYGNLRYSPLDQITDKNVQNLHVVAIHDTGIPHGHEGQPLVVNGTLYMVTPFPNNLIAMDITKPDFPQKWVFSPNPDIRAVGIACCDTVNRGASFGDGKIVYNTLDAHTYAVDAATGKQVWETKVGETSQGETETMAPVIVKNTVLVGISGGELGSRGRITALDLGTGKIKWRAYTTGSDQDMMFGPDFKPFYKKDQGQNLGIKNWGPDQWKHGGGPVWGWISYDPELNLIYYGSGNPGPWNEDQRPGDNNWTISIFARNPDTGLAKWAYQVVPHAGWDYDQDAENVLVDMNWGGHMRKLLINSGKTGYVMVMDRETGELLSAVPFVPVTWSKGYDLKTGMPNMVPNKETHEHQDVKGICPGNIGGKGVFPTAFSPRTGLLYIPATHVCMDYKGKNVNYIAGTPYIGATIVDFVPKNADAGELIGWDVANAKQVWALPSKDLPSYAGVLATGGDVIFNGTLDGTFRAVDARSGKVLWQFKTGSGIVGNPMTFKGQDGKQYVAIYSGIGGAVGGGDLPSVSSDDPTAALGAATIVPGLKQKTSPGGALYVFAL
jgi:PQQ-dependent dehydrogenase (methanol/ethanol family)